MTAGSASVQVEKYAKNAIDMARYLGDDWVRYTCSLSLSLSSFAEVLNSQLQFPEQKCVCTMPDNCVHKERQNYSQKNIMKMNIKPSAECSPDRGTFYS
jgi:hypothetical protein